jgi:hypothetical protein
MKVRKVRAGQGGGGRISEESKALRAKRNFSKQRLWAAWHLTGAYNGSNAFGAFDSGNKVDLFEKASSYTGQGENPYNNFLTREARAQFVVYPKAVGIYLGEGLGLASLPVKSIIAEHSMVEFKVGSSGSIIRQPVITMPPGLGVEQRFATANTAGADARFSETFGPMSPVGLFTPPPDTVFPESEQLKCFLSMDPGALNDLKGMTGSLPGRGAVIAVVLYAEVGLRISPSR